MVSDVFPNGCQQLLKVFHGIVNKVVLRVFAGIQNLIRVFLYGCATDCNTVEYRQYGN